MDYYYQQNFVHLAKHKSISHWNEQTAKKRTKVPEKSRNVKKIVLPRVTKYRLFCFPEHWCQHPRLHSDSVLPLQCPRRDPARGLDRYTVAKDLLNSSSFLIALTYRLDLSAQELLCWKVFKFLC